MNVSWVGLDPDDEAGAWCHHSPVSARMTAAPLITIAPGLSCHDADALALARQVRHLFVVDRGRLAGVVCRCDLHPHRDRDDLPVRAVMSTEVLALDEDATLGAATRAMREQRVGCLPVLEGSTLAGVITRGDLRRAGAPEELLGAGECCNCGTRRAVRAGPHGCDYCLDCLDLLEGEITDADYGEGD